MEKTKIRRNIIMTELEIKERLKEKNLQIGSGIM